MRRCTHETPTFSLGRTYSSCKPLLGIVLSWFVTESGEQKFVVGLVINWKPMVVQYSTVLYSSCLEARASLIRLDKIRSQKKFEIFGGSTLHHFTPPASNLSLPS